LIFKENIFGVFSKNNQGQIFYSSTSQAFLLSVGPQEQKNNEMENIDGN
jgi:hypothetical protein